MPCAQSVLLNLQPPKTRTCDVACWSVLPSGTGADKAAGVTLRVPLGDGDILPGTLNHRPLHTTYVSEGQCPW